MTIIPTVGVLIFKDNKILLVKHEEKAQHINGSYGWPGGRIEKSETLRKAAVRELAEETGLKAKEEDLIEFIYDLPPADIKRKNGETHSFSVKLFVCEKYNGSLQSSEETTPEWIEISELDSYDLLPNVKRIVTILSKVQ